MYVPTAQPLQQPANTYVSAPPAAASAAAGQGAPRQFAAESKEPPGSEIAAAAAGSQLRMVLALYDHDVRTVTVTSTILQSPCAI